MERSDHYNIIKISGCFKIIFLINYLFHLGTFEYLIFSVVLDWIAIINN